MDFSFSESEALMARAARGTQISWGQSTLVGRTGCWLARAGFDGAGIVAGFLANKDARPDPLQLPDIGSACWRATVASATLCPITTGSVLLDMPKRPLPKLIEDVSVPALIGYFLAQRARVSGEVIRMQVVGGEFETDGIYFNGSLDDWPGSGPLQLSLITTDLKKPLLQESRVIIDPMARTRLETLAARTYAPATEESRERGAG